MFTDLGTLGGSESLAFDINNRGHIAGVARTAANDVHGWPEGANAAPTTWSRLLIPSTKATGPRSCMTPSFQRKQLQAFVWSAGHIAFLGTLPGATDSFAEDINDRGQIVGWAGVGTGSHPLLWDRGVIVELDTLPGGTGALAAETRVHLADTHHTKQLKAHPGRAVRDLQQPVGPDLQMLPSRHGHSDRRPQLQVAPHRLGRRASCAEHGCHHSRKRRFRHRAAADGSAVVSDSAVKSG